jgi:lysyl-tRNA synthetase class I
MYQKPKAAKRLYFDVIPRTVDEYLQFLAAYPRQDAKAKLDNAVWHIHAGAPPAVELPISFGLLLNLVAASNAHDKDVLWGFIRRHAPDAGPKTHPLLDQLAGYAVRYYEDFVKPKKKFRLPDEVEARALRALGEALGKALAADAAKEPPQTDIGADQAQLPVDLGELEVVHADDLGAVRVDDLFVEQVSGESQCLGWQLRVGRARKAIPKTEVADLLGQVRPAHDPLA